MAACLLGGTLLAATPAPRTPAAALPQESGRERLSADAPQQLVMAMHVHSSATSGTLSLVELARAARQAGLDGLVMSENLGYELRYAPWPWRWFAEARLPGPTLERYGVARYLNELQRASEAEPDVMLIAGVEVLPYYYWTGSLLSGDLTLHDTQRNVLVVPPVDSDVADSAAEELLRSLPAVGNHTADRYGPRSLVLLLPGLALLLLSVWHLKRSPTPPARPRTWLLIAGAAAGAALLWLNFPFTAPALQPYDADAGHRPVRALFDHARARGALTFWSMPEAVDYGERSLGPVTIELSTPPYPAALSETRGYTGFGGVYADTVSVWEPGQAWDDALLEHLSGARPDAPWVVGESAFHFPGQAGKQLDDILTVLLVEERTRQAAFAALARGHGYALRRQEGGPDLRLPELALVAGALAHRQGDTLALGPGEASFDLALAVDDAAGSGTAVQVDVVRNGALHRRIEATTPLRERFSEGLAQGEDAAYYRVIVRAARPAYLVSNPIFVRRGGDDAAPGLTQ